MSAFSSPWTTPWSSPWRSPFSDDDFWTYIKAENDSGSLISHPIVTDTTGPHYNYEGGLFRDDEMVTGPNGALNFGAYEQLAKKTEDITDTVWVKVGSPNIIDSQTIQGTTQGSRIVLTIPTTEGSLYTLSFIASVQEGGQTSGYTFEHGNSATGNRTSLTISGVPSLLDVQFLGRVGDGIIDVGYGDFNTSDWAQVTISKFQVTETPIRMPYVPNDSAISTIAVPAMNGAADEGNRVAIEVDGDLEDILTSQGNVQFDWTPGFSYDDGSGSVNILSINEEINGMLYGHSNGSIYIRSTPTQYTSAPAVNYQANTTYHITGSWGTHSTEGANKMWLSVTDGTTTWDSSVVDFDGSFNPGDHLTQAFGATLSQEIQNIELGREPIE